MITRVESFTLHYCLYKEIYICCDKEEQFKDVVISVIIYCLFFFITPDF